MPKFAVYYIPTADSALYQRGSEILGYDVRAGKPLPFENQSRTALPEFDPAWVQRPQTYGFHMTTGYSLYFDKQDLPLIEAEMASVCACFGRNVRFELVPAPEPIPFWRDEIIVLHFRPNAAMLMLHTMLTARVNPFGKKSNVSEQYASQDPTTLNPVLAERVRRYYTPYMLDGWEPHFTLMMPYTGEQPVAMREALMRLFPPQPIIVTSICLLLREDHETHYRLYREFPVPVS